MAVSCKSEAELRKWGLAIDPRDPTKILAVDQLASCSTPPAPATESRGKQTIVKVFSAAQNYRHPCVGLNVSRNDSASTWGGTVIVSLVLLAIALVASLR